VYFAWSYQRIHNYYRHSGDFADLISEIDLLMLSPTISQLHDNQSTNSYEPLPLLIRFRRINNNPEDVKPEHYNC